MLPAPSPVKMNFLPARLGFLELATKYRIRFARGNHSSTIQKTRIGSLIKDLPQRGEQCPEYFRNQTAYPFSIFLHPCSSTNCVLTNGDSFTRASLVPRSEEHTSELQSP